MSNWRCSGFSPMLVNDIKSKRNHEFVFYWFVNLWNVFLNPRVDDKGQTDPYRKVWNTTKTTSSFTWRTASTLIWKYLQVGLLYNPGWIFLNFFVLWAQNGDATRLLANVQVPAETEAQVFDVTGAALLFSAQVCGPVKSLPLGCFHQVVVSDGEEFFSVLLLQFIRDSTQETAHSCNTHEGNFSICGWIFDQQKQEKKKIFAPLSAGATGESTAEKTDSLASSMSCWVNFPDFTQSTLWPNADKVCTEFGSLSERTKQSLFMVLVMLWFFVFNSINLKCKNVKIAQNIEDSVKDVT